MWTYFQGGAAIDPATHSLRTPPRASRVPIRGPRARARHAHVTRTSRARHAHVTHTSRARHAHVTRTSRARHAHVTRGIAQAQRDLSSRPNISSGLYGLATNSPQNRPENQPCRDAVLYKYTVIHPPHSPQSVRKVTQKGVGIRVFPNVKPCKPPLRFVPCRGLVVAAGTGQAGYRLTTHGSATANGLRSRMHQQSG